MGSSVVFEFYSLLIYFCFSICIGLYYYVGWCCVEDAFSFCLSTILFADCASYWEAHLRYPAILRCFSKLFRFWNANNQSNWIAENQKVFGPFPIAYSSKLYYLHVGIASKIVLMWRSQKLLVLSKSSFIQKWSHTNLDVFISSIFVLHFIISSSHNL